MQMHGDQFRHRVRPQKCPIHHRPRLLLHATMLIVDENRYQLRLAPLRIECLPRTLLRSPRNVLHRQTLFVRLFRLCRRWTQIPADSRPSTIGLYADVFAFELLASKQLALSPSHQFVSPQGQHSPATLVSDAGNPLERTVTTDTRPLADLPDFPTLASSPCQSQTVPVRRAAPARFRPASETNRGAARSTTK